MFVEQPWKSAYVKKIMQPIHFMHNIKKMVEHTFKVLRYSWHDVFKGMFNHFFRFMYEINIFKHKRSYNF